MRSLVGLAVLAILAVACGGASATAPQARAPAYTSLVFLEAGNVMRVVDAASGQVLNELPNGTPSPDWRWIYALSNSPSHDLLKIDTATGRPATALPAPDWANGVRMSANGVWMALTGPTSQFEIVDAAFAKRPVMVTLKGNFTFDGLSDDGQRLFLLEWVSPGRYQVRMYDLAGGRMYPHVIADKSEIGQLMSGEALTSLTSGDGAMQFTLYQRSAKNQAFVHVLPIGTTEHLPFAFCVDLPAPASGWGLVRAANGRDFYAVNPAAGEVVKLVSQDSPPTTQVSHLNSRASAPPDGRAPAAVVSPDGSTLYIATSPGLMALDTRSLKTTGQFLQNEMISSLGMAPDGSVLYALTGSGLLHLQPRNMTKVDQFSLEGPAEAIAHIA